MKYVVGVAMVSLVGFLMMFHVITGVDEKGTVVIAKQNASFAYTVMSVNEFLERWNAMLSHEKLQPGTMIYLKGELLRRKVIRMVDAK